MKLFKKANLTNNSIITDFENIETDGSSLVALIVKNSKASSHLKVIAAGWVPYGNKKTGMYGNAPIQYQVFINPSNPPADFNKELLSSEYTEEYSHVSDIDRKIVKTK